MFNRAHIEEFFSVEEGVELATVIEGKVPFFIVRKL